METVKKKPSGSATDIPLRLHSCTLIPHAIMIYIICMLQLFTVISTSIDAPLSIKSLTMSLLPVLVAAISAVHPFQNGVKSNNSSIITNYQRYFSLVVNFSTIIQVDSYCSSFPQWLACIKGVHPFYNGKDCWHELKTAIQEERESKEEGRS